MSDERPPGGGADNDPKDATTIEVGKILDLVGTNDTQYYGLWAVYTAVQFSAAGYGAGREIPYLLAFAVLAGLWAFNLGHLSFVLHCVKQANILKNHLNTVLTSKFTSNNPGYSEDFPKFINNLGRSYCGNVFVHLFIDVCASAALLLRAGPSTAG